MVPPKEVSQLETSPTWRSIRLSLLALLVLAVLYTFYAAASIIVPIVMAVLIYFALIPAVRLLKRAGLPIVLASLVVVGVLSGLVSVGIWTLGTPAAEWIERVPQATSEIKWKLRGLVQPLEEIRAASEEVSKIADDEEGMEVRIRDNSLLASFVASTGSRVTTFGITFMLAVFLLATDGRIGRDLARLLATASDVKRALRIGKRVQRELSAYFLTITVINTALGLATAAVCWLMGMPNPLFWGFVMGLFNYIPLVGPAAALVLIALASILTYPTVPQMLAPPLMVFGLNVIEANFVTPAIVALRLSLSPVVVLLAILAWGWLWGIAGVLLAVPLVVASKIVADNVPGLEAFGRVLGRRERSRGTPRNLETRLSLPMFRKLF